MDHISTHSHRPTPEELTSSLSALRKASSDVHSALRKFLAIESRISMSPPPQSLVRRLQQLEKAHELSRAAEARLELLVVHFGGSL